MIIVMTPSKQLIPSTASRKGDVSFQQKEKENSGCVRYGFNYHIHSCEKQTISFVLNLHSAVSNRGVFRSAFQRPSGQNIRTSYRPPDGAAK